MTHHIFFIGNWQKKRILFFSIYYHFRGFKSSCLSVLMTLLIVRFMDTTIKKDSSKSKGTIYLLVAWTGGVQKFCTYFQAFAFKALLTKSCGGLFLWNRIWNYRIVASTNTCYYWENQIFWSSKSRIVTCRRFFLGTKLFCLLSKWAEIFRILLFWHFVDAHKIPANSDNFYFLTP